MNIKIKLLIAISISTLLAMLFGYQGAETKTPSKVPPTQPIATLPATKVVSKSQNTTKIAALDVPSNQDTLCRNYLLPIPDLQWWQKDKKQLVLKWLRGLKTKGLDERKIDYIAQKSGIGIRFGRLLRSEKFNRITVPAIAELGRERMPNHNKVVFRSYFDHKDYDGLVSAYKNGKIPKDMFVVSDYGDMTVISQLLVSEEGKQFGIIEQLVKLGVEITYLDLITATKLGLPLSKVRYLFAAGGLAGDKVFDEYGRYSSLTTIAVKAANPELVGFWLTQGSLATPDIFESNALDLLDKPANEAQQIIKQEIFLELMAHNVTPNQKSSLEKLKSWLPRQLIKEYAQQLQSINNAELPKHWRAAVESEIAHIYHLLLLNQVMVDGSNTASHPCFNAAGFQLLRTALNKKRGSRSLIKTVKKTDAKITAQKRLNDIKARLTDADSIIAALGAEQDAIGKLAIRMYRRELMTQMVQDAQAKQANSAAVVDPQLEKNAKNAFELIQQGKWDDGMAKLEALHESVQDDPDTAKGLLNTMVIMELSTRANFTVITGLLDQGGELPLNAITVLVKNGNLDLTRQLLDYGLDLHFVDPAGHNALWYSVLYHSENMLSFLIDQGVTFKPTPYGFDALDQALFQFSFHREGIGFVAMLIRRGAPVELSHKQTTLEYKHKDPEIYQSLVKGYPQLKL